MPLSTSEISKLKIKAESLLKSGLDENNSLREITNYIKQAIFCIDEIIRGAPENERYTYAFHHAEMMSHAISWGVPWRRLIPCESSTIVLLDDDTNKLARKASNLLEEKEIIGALCYFDTIVKYSPATAYFLSKRANCRFGSGDKEGAIEDCTRAIELDPQQPDYYKYRAIYRYTLFPPDENPIELVEELLSDYKFALQKDPSAANVWMFLMCLNMLLNNWDEVISLSGQSQPFVIDTNDKAIKSWMLCLALILAGDTVIEEDKQQLRKADQVHGFFIERVFNHLQNYCQSNDVPEHTQKEIIEVDELLLDRMSDLNLSSKLYISLELWEKALKIIELYLEQNPADDKAWDRKCEILLKLDRFDDAFQAFRKSATDKILQIYGGEDGLLVEWNKRLKNRE